MPDRFVLVLAGGRGERFWPWSRPERPKQLLPLASRGRTLLVATVERALRLVPADRVVVLTGRGLKSAVERECGATGVRVLGEPVGRNTGPAVGAIAAWLTAQGADPAFAVLPADHAIDDEKAFTSDLAEAFDVAEREAVLFTFGVRPTRPDTAFGYVRRGAPIRGRVHRVAQFTEKPDRERAKAWVAAGDYFWNCGIFVWRPSVLLDALEASRPDLARPLRGLAQDAGEAAFERGLEEVFPGLESISVDYAVLEHAPNGVMIEPAFDWDDLGSWAAWARRQPRDPRGNVVFGDAVAVECDRCIVVGDGGTAAAFRQTDMVVVNAGGGALACRIEDSADVRRVTEAVETRART